MSTKQTLTNTAWGLAFLIGLLPALVYGGNSYRFPSIGTEICDNGLDDDGDGLVDLDDPDCQCSTPEFSFQNYTLTGGIAGQPGAVYTFSDVLPGVDARVTIVGFSHSDIVMLSLDEPAASNGGYDWAFQPIIDYNFLNADDSYDPAGDKRVTFRFDFVDQATGNPYVVPLMYATAVDVDGNSEDIREFVEGADFQGYKTETPTDLTLSGALKALGPLSTYDGVVETALNTMISFKYENATTITITYGANYADGGVHDDYGEGRMNCLYFKCYDFNTSLTCPTVSVSGAGGYCIGETATLSATVEGGTGTCSLQWQSSPDGTAWTDIPGAVGMTYSVAATPVIQYFRAGYFCSDQSTCGTVASNVVSVLATPCGGVCDIGPDDQSGATNTVIPAGSYIIDMGVVPQTIDNALKPYGLVWELLDNQVPVLWSIRPGKGKDEADFTYNGYDFKGGPFIITAEQRTSAVDNIIANWESRGVVGVTTSADITVPINRTLNYSMHWTLDQENGDIAEQFLLNAGIPSTAYDWVLPGALSCCNDIFVMPHATPTWSTHSNLLSWNDCEANGGCGGAIWAGCRAVSNMENLVNPADANERMNFLMADPQAPATNPAVVYDAHADGTIPYQHDFIDHPVMQFMGLMDGGQENGSEQIYLPTTGWRPTTHIGIWDPDQPDLGSLSPGPAAKVAFGPAFGQTGRGYVAYEAGHDIAKGTTPAYVAAQRAFFNFSFMALGQKAIQPVMVVPGVVKSGNAYQLSASASGGSGNYTFTWTSNCGGSFDNPNSPNAIFTAPIVSAATTCIITLEVTDDCGVRSGFSTIEITVDPPTPEECDNGLDDDADGLTDCDDPDCPCFNGEYEFCTYNLDLPFGTTFNIRDFVHRKNSIYGPDFSEIYFTYTAAGANHPTNPADWHLADFNNGNDVTVTAADAAPGTGNGNDGEYRIYLVRNGQPDYDDFMTIRVGRSSNVASAQCDFEICGNGLDDDGDGLTDCDDPDCNGTSVSITGGATLCSGNSISLTANASGGPAPYVFDWSAGPGSSATVTVAPASTTTYTVTVTNANGCTSVGEVTVPVIPSPSANAGADETLCRTFSSTLSATASGGTTPYTFSWSHAPGTGNDLVVSPLTTTTYTVTVTSDNGCNDTDQITITVQDCPEICLNGLDDDGDGLTDCDDPDCGPSVDAGSDVNICPGAPHLLTASATGGSGGLSYAWSNGFAGQSQIVNPLVTTTYTVTVTSGSGCTATSQVTVNVILCSEDCTNGIDDDGDGLIDCDDPDCIISAAPNLADDSYTTCPGMPFSERVTYNDGNLQNPVFSIASAPANGSVLIDPTGKFTYTPSGNDCMTDQFVYQVCNLITGCCSQATVTINLGDTISPVLIDVPADITISCDDVVPLPPNITAYDECPGIFIDFNETTTQHYVGACESYTITRTWTATDLCGNQAVQSQNITVVDNVKPEIFQVYTLANGKRLVAGITKNVTDSWKYVPFPVTFSTTPIVFTTVVSNNDLAAVTVRQRNIYSQGFELRLYEQESADGVHSGEDVAWLAIEPGVNDDVLKLETGRWMNLDQNPAMKNFTALFGNDPGLITVIQSANDTDPVGVRVSAISANSATIRLQEETSADAETTHGPEHVGYLAFDPGQPLLAANGESFGETGKINLTNAWVTIPLSVNYTKPVVIFGGIADNDGEGVNVRVRNLTSNSFEVRLQEWDYLDGNHPAESVSWLVVEGAIPGNMGYYCSGSVSGLQVGVNVFAMDNCDDQTAFGYTETPSATGNGTLTIRTWMAIDDCGNTNLITRYDTCSTAALQLRALLQGPAVNNGNSSLMRDDLRQLNFIPLQEPFSDLPAFPHVVDTTPDTTGTTGTGNGNGVPPGYLLVCHKPGTPAEKTLLIPESDLSIHLNHGDMEGGCNGETTTEGLPAGALVADYRTIADGNWADPNTWMNGTVPPSNMILNKTISIEHQVTLTNGSLHIKNNSTLWITNGGLTIAAGNLISFKSEVVMATSDLNVSGKMDFSHSLSKLFAHNSTITVGMDFNSKGSRWLENVCLTVNGSYINFGTDSLFYTNIIVEQNLSNNDYGFFFAKEVKVDIKSGILQNTYNGTAEGAGLIIWAENGLLSNLGNWTLGITQYCAAGSAMGFGASLPAAEDCSGMADYFLSCNALTPVGLNGSGNTGTLGDAEIALSGTLDPVLLSVSGPDAIVDWILLEIRDPDTEEILRYATVALQRDGDIVSEDGSELINFPDLIEGDYLVALRHRNHLPLMTDVPMFLSILNPPLIDFTDPALPVRGNNVGGHESNGTRLMWGGDFNEDGRVIYQGPSNDVFYLFSRVLSDPDNTDYLANYIVQGYDLNDFNLDGNIIYQGPNNDRASLLYFTVLSHANNSGFLANFIVEGTLP